MGAQETIIYRLVMRNPSYDANFSFLIFFLCATFGGKMDVAATRAPYNGLRPQNPTKMLTHRVDLLGQPLSRKHVFEIFRGKPPLNRRIFDVTFICS